MKEQYIKKGWSASGLFPLNRDKIKSKAQIKNYEDSEPQYVRPSDSRPRDILQTPKKRQGAELLADTIINDCSPTTGMRVAKLAKFGEQHCAANVIYQERIALVREEAKAEERATKAIRVGRLPNVSYTREGVLQATRGTHKH